MANRNSFTTTIRHEQGKALGFLSTADLAASALIEVTMRYEYYGRYERIDYEMPPTPPPPDR